MAFNTHSRKARAPGLTPTHTRTHTTFSNQSYQNQLPGCSRVESGNEISATGWTSSECASCLSEPNPSGNCRLPADADEFRHVSGCNDPVCARNICDECSDHEECCDDCAADCWSDCGISFGCDELDAKSDDTYALGGSLSELFGDQTAQTFGFGRRLPQLETNNLVNELNDFGKIPDDTALSTFPNYNMDEDCPQSTLEPHHNPWALHAQLNPHQATTLSRPNCISDHQLSPNHGLACADTATFTRKTTSHMRPSESDYGSADPTDTTGQAHHDHVCLLTETGDSAKPTHTALQCQWADLNGQPCGKTLTQGESMHEHLKIAHGVKNEVFCRWAGCSVGVHTASPHRFASSVERHTWGHSGYRPYKCSACSEGFAAASVRDEHFTNIHLRKKVFACDMCAHQCTSATNLKRHKDDKHSSERFQCEFCNQNDKRRLFPRGPNLARHLRNCKYVLALFPEAAAARRTKADWLPPGYKRGHHGMDRAKVTPPNYLPAQQNA